MTKIREPHRFSYMRIKDLKLDIEIACFESKPRNQKTVGNSADRRESLPVAR